MMLAADRCKEISKCNWESALLVLMHKLCSMKLNNIHLVLTNSNISGDVCALEPENVMIRTAFFGILSRAGYCYENFHNLSSKTNLFFLIQCNETITDENKNLSIQLQEL